MGSIIRLIYLKSLYCKGLMAYEKVISTHALFFVEFIDNDDIIKQDKNIPKRKQLIIERGVSNVL